MVKTKRALPEISQFTLMVIANTLRYCIKEEFLNSAPDRTKADDFRYQEVEQHGLAESSSKAKWYRHDTGMTVAMCTTPERTLRTRCFAGSTRRGPKLRAALLPTATEEHFSLAFHTSDLEQALSIFDSRWSLSVLLCSLLRRISWAKRLGEANIRRSLH